MKRSRYRQRGGASDPRNRVWHSARWRAVRQVVYLRDNGTCQVCGCSLHPKAWVCDHKVPLVEMLALGDDPFDLDALQALCHSCSGKKDGPRSQDEDSRPNRFMQTVI